jgi:chemotaxis family two-component system response regulator Rcp1
MKSIKLLLVEDNEGDILLTREALESVHASCEIEIAKNGIKAIELLTSKLTESLKSLPELIFLDINLPKKNGQDVLNFVKSHPDLKHIPTIMLTTSSYEKDIELSYQNQANCYIAKPVDAYEYIEVVGKLMDFWLNIARIPAIKS